MGECSECGQEIESDVKTFTAENIVARFESDCALDGVALEIEDDDDIGVDFYLSEAMEFYKWLGDRLREDGRLARIEAIGSDPILPSGSE